jgi:hypothetical protein
MRRDSSYVSPTRWLLGALPAAALLAIIFLFPTSGSSGGVTPVHVQTGKLHVLVTVRAVALQ